MSRVLGVDASPTGAFLALVVEGEVQTTPEKLEWPAGEATERLVPLLRSVQDMIAEHRIDAVCVLLPQRTRQPTHGYFGVADRVILETIIRLGSALAGRPAVLMERATVRARLGFPLAGTLEDYVERVLPQPAGRYWKAGRALAALAALGLEANDAHTG